MAMVADQKTSHMLECPVCLELLKPPVNTCENGHGTCRPCRNSLKTCGICRGHFTDSKNTLLDEMIKSLLIRCSNSSAGCKECYPAAWIKKHEQRCYFRKVSCFVCKKGDISLPDLNVHFTKEHGNGTCRHHKDAEDLSSSVSIKLLDLDEYFDDDNAERFYIIYIAKIETNFLVRCFYNSQKGTLFLCVQFLGEKQEKARKYIYDIKINQGLASSNKAFFICTGQCVPYNNTLNWENCERRDRIIPLHINSIFLKLQPDHFDCDIKIRKSLP